jgi:dTDP-4-dehydrorhamnose reductase
MTKILLLGKDGQLGCELQRMLMLSSELVALGRSTEGEFCGDLLQLDAVVKTIRHIKPDVIVNAAAYTLVDKAESNIEEAMLINAEAPGVLAQEAAKINALLIHYSTDYVFNGKGCVPWRETDEPLPLNIYGGSKLAGERAIQASGCRYFILRTSWIYSTYRENFIKTILRLASEKEILNVVNDQTGAPTSASFLADMTVHVIETALENRVLSGVYHLVPKGDVSWYEYAQFILGCAQALGQQLACTRIVPISSLDYPTPALRPHNSRLDTKKFQEAFSCLMPSWDEGVHKVIKALLSNESIGAQII